MCTAMFFAASDIPEAALQGVAHTMRHPSAGKNMADSYIDNLI